MKDFRFDELGNLSMLELFRVEVENQTAILTGGLLELERAPESPRRLEALMRAAHSIKGAARIINLPAAVRVAHAMEDCFVAAQQNPVQLSRPRIDALLQGVDLLVHVARQNEAGLADWERENAAHIQSVIKAIAAASPAPEAELAPSSPLAPGPLSAPPAVSTSDVSAPAAPPAAAPPREPPDRVLRLTAENLNRLLGLAGESLVESRWLRPFFDSLQRLKARQTELHRALNDLRDRFREEKLSDRAQVQIKRLLEQTVEIRQGLNDRLEELEMFDRRATRLSNSLYLEALRSRMRPFADGARRFPRMVRDLARACGKQARLEISGETTQVDRDILDRLETPLAHLLRNAVDHGCETPEERRRLNKPPEALIRLEARQSAGMFLVIVSDDGPGADLEGVRRAIVEKRIVSEAAAEKMTEAQLLEFLFLPGFSLKRDVTEISGRGVGLDVVQNMVKEVRGSARVSTQRGQGMRVQLQLPLTLSVVRALLVDIGGEPYAIPLARIVHALKVPRDQLQTLEGRHHFNFRNQQVGLLTAHQVLECGELKCSENELPVVVLGEPSARYGLVVDRFLGERELVVQPLDARLGRIQDVAAAALMEDGSGVLVLNVEDMARSIERLISTGALSRVAQAALEAKTRKRKRILAVDDSLTVRELQRKLLTSRGYLADVAVDGMEGWNAVRTGVYDLVITDVDMPRLDGIELATLIKKDPNLRSVPIMIVSYKEGEEDKLRGLAAGADYYLTKSSYQDATLLQAVWDLIGEPEA